MVFVTIERMRVPRTSVYFLDPLGENWCPDALIQSHCTELIQSCVQAISGFKSVNLCHKKAAHLANASLADRLWFQLREILNDVHMQRHL